MNQHQVLPHASNLFQSINTIVYGLHACVSTGEYPLQFCNAELVCIRLKHGLPAIQAHHSYALYVRVILKTHHGVNDDWTIVHVHKLFWDILPHTVAGTSGCIVARS